MKTLVIGVATVLGLGATAALAAVSGSLPVGDGKYTTAGPKQGWIYSCGPHNGGGGAQGTGPWLKSDGTWDPSTKISVQGSVRWPSSLSIVLTSTTRRVSTNDLPRHATGTFPIQQSDPAFQYDRNPNSIRAQSFSFTLPADPKVAARPSCIAGPIGIMLTGALLFDGLDAEGRDAQAHEIQDACGGHPERTGVYHYHGVSPCADTGTSATAHSKLVGYAMDGFGIYGSRGESGTVLSDADLDVCHGHTHVITWRGKKVRMYHYHATAEYPYTIGCFRGTPVRLGPA